jgi:type I restriction enzyme R subunit
MEKLLEEAELDEEQERKLEQEFSREYQLVTRDDRLEKIAEDIVEHFMGRGQEGKAMVVCIDKATAVRMYDKVRKYWKQYLADLEGKLAVSSVEETDALLDKIRYMKETDMAVVVSQSQNEVQEMKKKGLDIRPHRKRMVKEDLDEKFKDPDNPLRVAFVCAMWMTGFDVPCCSTIYLDKPMKNHTLMQTIARANRVFGDKVNGLIVDYFGVFRSLQRALAIYGSGAGGGIREGDTPVKNKAALVEELKKAINDTRGICVERGIDLDKVQRAEGFQRVKLLEDAVEAIIVNDESKRRCLLLVGNVNKLYRAILPDRQANEFLPICTLLGVIGEKIRSLTPQADISGVMAEVEGLLDESIAAEGYAIQDRRCKYKTVDLSKIDFEALKQKFEKSLKRIEAERLRGLINSKLAKMVRLNKSRMDYLERFQQMIDEYNAGSMNVDEFFRQLTEFAKELNREEKRSISEQLSEEELAVFDLLTKPHIELTNKDRKQVKKLARELLGTLKKEKLVLDWRKRQQSRAAVLVSIEYALDGLPPSYSQDTYREKCNLVYQHIFDSYYGEGRSVYTRV